MLTFPAGRAVVGNVFRRLQIIPYQHPRRFAYARPGGENPYPSPPPGGIAPPPERSLPRPESRRMSPEGVGFDVIIEFTPDRYLRLGDRNMGNAGGREDEVLLHEMVHGLRRMLGWAIIPHMPGYDNADEFFAILVANYYSAERGLPIRQDHQDNRPMREDPATWPENPDHRWLVRRFRGEHSFLATRLWESRQSTFNPLREVFRLRPG